MENSPVLTSVGTVVAGHSTGQKMIQQKDNPLKKTCNKVDGFEKLASNDIFDGKKVPFNASIFQLNNKGFSNAKRCTKKFDKQKRKHFEKEKTTIKIIMI